MSVSIALIPVALVIRGVMGKEKFERWIESSQIKVPTSVSSAEELGKILRDSGYDALPFGNLIKTHIDGEKQFFFWEQLNGKWTAIFSIYDDPILIEDFSNTLIKTLGYQVFNTPPMALYHEKKKAEESSRKPINENINAYKHPTNMTDETLLKKTLEEYNIQYKEVSGNIVCEVEKTKLVFTKNNMQNYDVEISNIDNFNQIQHHLAIMDEDYKKNVQENTYNNLIKKLHKSEYVIEEESILDDNSILLTISVN